MEVVGGRSEPGSRRTTFPAFKKYRRNPMKLLRMIAILLGSILIPAGYYGTHADNWNKMTKVTFNDTVQVPGTVLALGTYTFKLADSSANRHIVQIFNEDNTSLITTVLAVPNYRLEPTGKTVLAFAERPVDQPVALEAWFDRKSTRLNSSHLVISYAVFCLKKKKNKTVVSALVVNSGPTVRRASLYTRSLRCGHTQACIMYLNIAVCVIRVSRVFSHISASM